MTKTETRAPAARPAPPSAPRPHSYRSGEAGDQEQPTKPQVPVEPPKAQLPTVPTDRSASHPNLFGLADEAPPNLILPEFGGGVNTPGGHYIPRRQSGGPSRYSPQVPGVSSYAAQRAMQPQLGPTGPTASIGTGYIVQKPFEDYRLPDPISPYEKMYRTGATEATNYFTLVRPALQQRQANVRFGGQIRGLQGAARQQGSAIQMLNRDTRSLQGRPSLDYYRNYNSFYPGLQR